jgi:putative two-component system response regulator
LSESPAAGLLKPDLKDAAMPEAGTKPAKIMVVDDEFLNRKLIQAMLKPQGYEVVLAEDGADCLAKAEEDPPDLILMDIMMPKMNGFEVVATLRAKLSLTVIPVVMVTALQDINDRVKALEVGADDFLTKPVDRMELRARVRSLLKVKAYNDHMANYRRELEREVAARTEELRLAHSKLREASLETIFRLARAAEYKDEDTGTHIVSMSLISAFLAERLGLNSTVVERILYASPMHDIGKIGIPDRILTKNGPLNDEEWSIMRMHPVYGGQILEGSDIGFLKLGEVISLTHHEKWDGSGYPHGLAGTQIPLSGRIVAVADVFDALRSKRPYKPPLTIDQTVDIIRAGRGTHFDPKVVDALLNNLDGVLKLWETAQSAHTTTLQMSSHNLESIHV